MSDELVVVLLPQGGRDADGTRESVRAEVGGAVPVVVLGDQGTAERILGAALVAVIRAGDRWRAGTYAARAQPLTAHPDAGLVAAGHARVDETGRELLVVPAPRAPIDPTDLLLRRDVEASSVIVRGGVLDADALELLGRPHGDLVLWSRITREHGMLSSGEIASDVLVDPDRHGSSPRARVAELLEQCRALPEEPGACTVRRELLRRVFVDGTAADGPVDLRELLADEADAGARAVVADLQWALERQQDALSAERVEWPRDQSGYTPEAGPAPLPDEEPMDARVEAIHLAVEVAVRDSKIRRLEAEIYRRDAMIEELRATTAGGEA
jgi:hypothetical protein